MNKIRILYLSNHVTLSKFEIPMLQSLGYEVYMPKKPDFDISCRVDWDLDKTLSIPQSDLNILNEIDFYYSPLNQQQVVIINKYFDIALFVSYQQMTINMLTHFEGVLCFRAFGSGITYTQYFTMQMGYGVWGKIEKLGNRFWFGAGYETITESECEVLRNRNLFMPLGLPNAVVNDRWIGGEKKILFPCPKIKTNAYMQNNYDNFRKVFKDVPYWISGVQPIAVEEDKNVLGHLSEEEYTRVFAMSACMYYYSRWKTHIHYTPAEAVRWGLPLLYLKDGLLDTIGGEDLPGRCKDEKEVRKKAIRLLNGDRRLAEHIRASQGVLLNVFTREYCQTYWEQAMKVLESNIPKKTSQALKPSFGTRKRIGVLLPLPYLGGVLDYTIRLIKALYMGINDNQDKVDIVFGYIESDCYHENEHFMQLKEMNIAIRSFKWEKITNEQMKNYVKLKRIDEVDFLSNCEKYIPNDGCGCFRDCDFLIFTADRVPGPTFIPIPYATVLHDFIQRMVPETFSQNAEIDFLRFSRNSEFNLTTTPVTKDHAVKHEFLPEQNIHVIPIPVELIELSTQIDITTKLPVSYFVWSTNMSRHKNHIRALKALSDYYLSGGTIKCCITGVETDMLQRNFKGVLSDYQREIKKIIEKDIFLKKNIVVLGNMPKKLYWNVLAKASFVLHPGYADNGNFTCFDAACLGVPTISSRYPAMEFTDNYFNLNMEFFDPFNENDLTAVLLKAEKNLHELKSRVPSKKLLTKYVISNQEIYKKIYDIIKFYIKF